LNLLDLRSLLSDMREAFPLDPPLGSRQVRLLVLFASFNPFVLLGFFTFSSSLFTQPRPVDLDHQVGLRGLGKGNPPHNLLDLGGPPFDFYNPIDPGRLLSSVCS